MFECSGAECEFDGVCDKWGCGYNPYALGNKDYYGYDKLVDTTRPFTVVTQFPADQEGTLIEYRRFYIQDGKKIDNAPETSSSDKNWMDDEYCSTKGDGTRRYFDLGATAAMGEAMSRGMVLALSVWWDEGGHMTWLDGDTSNGPCKDGEGSPDTIRENQPDAAVTFSNIKWGELDTTYSTGGKCKKSKRIVQ